MTNRNIVPGSWKIISCKYMLVYEDLIDIMDIKKIVLPSKEGMIIT